MPFFYVRVAGHVRASKASDPRAACKDCYGVIYDRPDSEGDVAHYYQLPKNPAYMSAKLKHAIIHSNEYKDGWKPLSEAPKS